jgi:hypothetical protein
LGRDREGGREVEFMVSVRLGRVAFGGRIELR